MGIEVVVRPVVFPNIRPQAPRALPPEDDPKKGFCEIKGSGGNVITFTISSSFSVTYGRNKERKRRVDVGRVYQERDDGSVNEKNFIDVEVPNKIWKQGSKGPAVKSVEEQEQRARDARMYEQWTELFKKLDEKKNIAIKERNKIIENKDKE